MDSAACRIELGSGEAARTELRRYLQRYPEGRFIRDARSALESATAN